MIELRPFNPSAPLPYLFGQYVTTGLAMTISNCSTRRNTGQGLIFFTSPSPLTLKNNYPPKENDPTEVAGPPWRSEPHGSQTPRRSRMDKVLKTSEKRNTMALLVIFS